MRIGVIDEAMYTATAFVFIVNYGVFLMYCEFVIRSID